MAIQNATLQSHYPWTSQTTPLITCAPMRLISGPKLACAVSLAGGLGFLGGGYDISITESWFQECSDILSSSAFENDYTYSPNHLLPIGIGYIIWAIPDDVFINTLLPILEKYRPSAVWLYAARGDHVTESSAQLALWSGELRKVIPDVKIWIQVGSVAEAVSAVSAVQDVDVLVVQGVDAGGHGLNKGAGLMSLLPEVWDALSVSEKRPHMCAAGGIAIARQVLACKMLGADAVTLGTAFLTSPEANTADGYKSEVVRASDGGQLTVRSRVYDTLRGTNGWPERYGGRGVVNRSWDDWNSGSVDSDENTRLYEAAAKNPEDERGWGPQGRLTTYAGTGVGLVQGKTPASEVVRGLNEAYKTLIRA